MADQVGLQDEAEDLVGGQAEIDGGDWHGRGGVWLGGWARDAWLRRLAKAWRAIRERLARFARP